MTQPRGTPQGPVLVIGALSDIGRAIALEYGGAGLPLILAARDAGRLTRDVEDLKLRLNVAVRAVECDVLHLGDVAAWCDGLGETPMTVVSVVGLLGDQMASRTDAALARDIIDTNFTGPALLLGELAGRMEARGSGTVIGVSSVAGDRGRASNYVYGSAKAGLTAFLSGLRNRLAGAGVGVITVKPGFVATRMTAGMTLPKPLTASPAQVARAVITGHRKGADVIYVLGRWRLIMTIIRLLPEAVFKRMSLG